MEGAGVVIQFKLVKWEQEYLVKKEENINSFFYRTVLLFELVQLWIITKQVVCAYRCFTSAQTSMKLLNAMLKFTGFAKTATGIPMLNLNTVELEVCNIWCDLVSIN
jgi:hypothetical protein